MSDYPAIPTQYTGVNFRSRLEARWAAMFDLLGWEWAYEPLDLNGYIPDFVVSYEHQGKALWEIKPLITTDRSEAADTIAKIETSGWIGNWVVAGAVLHPIPIGKFGPGSPGCVNTLGGDVVIGHMGCMQSTGNRYRGRATLDAQDAPYVRITDDDSDFGGRDVDPWSADYIFHQWKEAGNKVQWRSVADRVNATPRTEKQKFESLGLSNAPVMPAHPIPPDLLMRATLASIKGKRTTDPAKLVDKELIAQVLDKKFLGPNELLAAQTLVRVCPVGTSDDQIVGLLMGCNMREDRARELVRRARPGPAQPDQEEFVLSDHDQRLFGSLRLEPDGTGLKNTPDNIYKILMHEFPDK